MKPPRAHIRGALRRNIFGEAVPGHRVLAANGGVGRDVDWGDHGEDWEVRREMLEEEGARFDRNGKVLGGAFIDFR